MKAKLIKTDGGYHLKGLIKDVPKGINVYNKINDKECHFGFGTHSGKLSIKNCEAIELGYDLDEMSKEETRKFLGHDVPENIMLFITHSKMFQKGFQKALEILGDKKFSEDDMKEAMLNTIELTDWQKDQFRKDGNYHMAIDIIQSLQQNEWEVEVVMDRIPADLAPDGWDVFPKLDAKGCIILKRVE